MNNILELRIKLKIDTLKDLCKMYLEYLEEDESNTFAKEKYNEYKNQIRLLEDILKGE